MRREGSDDNAREVVGERHKQMLLKVNSILDHITHAHVASFAGNALDTM